eukprot:2973107-Prymnesium_polylepis.2
MKPHSATAIHPGARVGKRKRVEVYASPTSRSSATSIILLLLLLLHVHGGAHIPKAANGLERRNSSAVDGGGGRAASRIATRAKAALRSVRKRQQPNSVGAPTAAEHARIDQDEARSVSARWAETDGACMSVHIVRTRAMRGAHNDSPSSFQRWGR